MDHATPATSSAHPNQRRWDAANPESAHMRDARKRAKAAGVPGTLTLADVRAILAPMRCSVTGLPLMRITRGAAGPLSPSIDRLVPEQGYTRENTRLVCQAFNRLRKADGVEHDTTHAHRAIAEARPFIDTIINTPRHTNMDHTS